MLMHCIGLREDGVSEHRKKTNQNHGRKVGYGVQSGPVGARK
jgi:hypothetical protein